MRAGIYCITSMILEFTNYKKYNKLRHSKVFMMSINNLTHTQATLHVLTMYDTQIIRTKVCIDGVHF